MRRKREMTTWIIFSISALTSGPTAQFSSQNVVKRKSEQCVTARTRFGTQSVNVALIVVVVRSYLFEGSQTDKDQQSTVIKGTSGLVVEQYPATVQTRVRFPAGAELFFVYYCICFFNIFPISTKWFGFNKLFIQHFPIKHKRFSFNKFVNTSNHLTKKGLPVATLLGFHET